MNTTTPRTDCDVLVVGAGPTGLTLAAHLLARDVRTRVIDKDPGVARLSRAIGFQPRTLETLDMMGIAERFLDIGHRVRRITVWSGATRMVGIDMARSGSAYPFMLALPQQRTEALLRERVAELGGTVEAGVELVDVAVDGEVVTATVRSPDGRDHEISTAYLVGCDGAHSRVRHLLDAPFLGQPYPWDWLLADARVDWAGRADQVHVFARPDGLPLSCIPITDGLWRLSLPMPGERGGATPTLDEIQALVDERCPGRMVISEPETLTCFRCQIRSTTVYRRGRVLLAGDAVHIHSPAGAQGMNTGMLDAANLGWKLALVVAGAAADPLLDSYGNERGPVARQVLDRSSRMVRFATMPRSLTRTLRDASLPAFRLPVVQRRLAAGMSHVGVGYPDSPLTRRGRVRRVPKPGRRMPDVEISTPDGPGRLYAALRRGRHVLVAADGAAGPVGWMPFRDLVDVVTATGMPRGAVALVRPDGYLAAVGTAGIQAYLHDLARRARIGAPA